MKWHRKEEAKTIFGSWCKMFGQALTDITSSTKTIYLHKTNRKLIPGNFALVFEQNSIVRK